MIWHIALVATISRRSSLPPRKNCRPAGRRRRSAASRSCRPCRRRPPAHGFRDWAAQFAGKSLTRNGRHPQENERYRGARHVAEQRPGAQREDAAERHRRATGAQRTCLRQSRPRQPFDAIWVTACSTMAVWTGSSTSSTPIRMMPPAMPKTPGQERRPEHHQAEQEHHQRGHGGLLQCSSCDPIERGRQTEIYWPSINFPEARFPEASVRRLPYLNGIKAFEAAARSGSFAAAAGELNVSPAAISRMVHLLEERLGVALFERKANRLALTATGHTYQAGLTTIFDALANLTSQVTSPVRRARAHDRRRADLRDPLADPAAGGFPEGRARHRGALHHRRRGGAVRRRLDLRDHARRRRLAGAHRRADVRRRPAAGVRAADRIAPETRRAI